MFSSSESALYDAILQLPKRLLWWYTVSNGDQQHKYNFHIPYFKHGKTTFHRCVHKTTRLVIHTLTITRRRFIDLHKSERTGMARKRCTKPLRLPMELTHVKQINTRSKSPTVHNSSLALPKTCFIHSYDIEPRPAAKTIYLQALKNLRLPTTDTIQRGSQDPANRLNGKRPFARRSCDLA